MRYMKKLTAAIISVSLCVTNLVAFAEVSDKQTIQDYFETKGSDDRETAEIIVSFSGDIKSDNIDSIDSIIQDGLKISSDKEMEIGDISKPAEPATKIDTSLEKVLDENTVLIKTNDVETTLQALKSNENVVYAQPNYRLYTASEDAINSKLWAMENKGQIINGTQGNEKADLNIQAAWDITRGSEDVVVAVLDTGIDITHPALAGNIWVNTDEQSNGSDSDGNGYIDDINGWDFVNNDSSVFDKAEIDEHGTHMAGIIAANGQNGVYGVAPNVKIMPLKVMENDSGYTSDIIEAIGYAEANGAKIVNCSFAGLDYNPALEDAISKSDMLFVTAAGNFATSTDDLVAFPACYDCKNIISVGASDNTGSIAALSSYGDLVNVYAPGTGIYSTLPDEQYDFKDGTSCSAAYVSGIAALLYSEYPELTAEQAKEAICTKPNGDEMQILSNSETQLDAKAILDFDVANAKSSMPKVIDNNITPIVGEANYPFSFYDEDGVRFSLNTENVSRGSLTVSTIGENENAETIFYTELSDDSRHIVVPNIGNDTEYNFLITYTQGTTIHNYYGKLKKGFIEEENKYLTESYNIVTNNYTVDNDQNVMLASANGDISLMSNEQENNNAMSNATEIKNDDDMYGTISYSGDIDWYKVKFTSSGVANFWLGQVPSGCNYQLELYNASGRNLAGSYNGNGEQELIPFYEVNANTLYYIKVYSASGYSSSQYKLRTKWYPFPDDYESNDSFSEATRLSNGISRYANINHPEDVDFYKFTLSKRSYVEVNLSNIPSGCWYDMDIYNVANENGLIARANKSGRSKQWQRILPSGTYYVKIYSHQKNTYAEGNYKISLDVGNISTMQVPGDKSVSVGSSKVAAYTFSISSQCGAKIVLADVSTSDFDLYLYKTSGSTLTEVAAGATGLNTGETISATLSSGDYVLAVKRYSGSETSFTLSATTTTTAKEAEITLSGFPSAMASGDSKTAKITVTNNGMNAWTRADGYKLGGLSDTPSFTNSEFTLTSSDTIQYGQSKTFSVNLTAPSVSAVQDYTLAFRMKQNSSYFNYKSDNKVITVTGNIESISAGNTKAISGVTTKYYKLNVSSTANYVFRTMKYNTSCDTELYLYDSKMNQLAKNDDIYDGDVYSRNYYSKIERSLSSGTYYICVKKHSGGNVQCYLNVDTYAESNITSSANVSNKYEGYFKYTVSTAGTYMFSTKRYSRNCDTYLILLDANGNVVEKNNDSGTVYAKIETDLSKGTYYIRVSSNNYIVKGEDAKTYCTLTVGLQSSTPSTSESASISISTPTAGSVIKTYNGNSIKISGSASNCSSVTVKVGDKTLSNVKLNGSKYEAYYTPTESGTYTIKVTGKAIWGSSPSEERTVTIAVNDDSDNFNSSPTAINSGTERVAAIDYAGDVDCFSFTPKETGSYKIYSSGSVDLKGILYDNDKVTSIGTSYNAPESINFKLAKTLEKNKTYYIRVDAETSGATGKYSINIEKIDEPNDTHLSEQWGILNIGQSYNSYDIDGNPIFIKGKIGNDINVLPVWEYTKGKDVTVAVVDTGIEITHDDLKNSISNRWNGYNYVHQNTTIYNSNEEINPSGWQVVSDNDPDPYIVSEYWRRYGCMDINGHGTHVSGIIAAEQNNAKGVTGVAPEAKIVPLKVLGMPINGVSTYNQDIFNIIHAVEYINDNNIEIANMSIDFWNNADVAITELENAMKNASNTLFVVAAGNNGVDLSIDSNHYPACANVDNIIVVANLMSDGTLSSSSNYGGNTSIAAPGTGIYSTCPTNDYCLMNGTSMAAPHVSGAAALLKSYYSDLTPLELKQRLISANNVSYNSQLYNKVSSNGSLNVWNSFCNDSTSPRKAPKVDGNQNIKERILNIKNNAKASSFTNKVFVNIIDGIDKTALLDALVPNANIIDTMQLTGSFVIEFETVQEAMNSIELLNENENVIYAEPVYNTRLLSN